MNNFKRNSGSPVWLMAMFLAAMLAGCGGGGGGDTAQPGPGPGPDPAPEGDPPTVVATAPAATTPMVTGVALNTQVTASFSKDMDPATISTSTITLECPAGTAVTGTVSYDEVSRAAVFSPTNLLPAATVCVATITTGAQDTDGLALANDFVWEFETGLVADTTRPRVISTIPDFGDEDVATNISVTATFSEQMDPLTINDTTFTLQGPGATAVEGTVAYSVNARTATFTSTDPAPLPTDTLFTATITTGAADLAGNALAGNEAPLPAASDFVWTFTTGETEDTTAPTIVFANPADGAIDVLINSNINATFSEDMTPSTITTATFTLQESGPPLGPAVEGVISYNAPDRIATLDPKDDLLPGTEYTATVTTGAEDLAGNALASGDLPNPWTFTTVEEEVEPPPALAIDLGVAATFGLASRAGLTTTGVTVVNGDIALHPLASCEDATGNAGAGQSCLVHTYASPTGMTVNGAIFWAGDPFDNGETALAVTEALSDAWIEGKDKVATFATGFLGGELGGPKPDGKVLLPGVYREAALGMAADSVATMDAQGDPNAIFIFQVDSSFVDSGTPLLPTVIKLVNGAQARNIWFVIGLDFTSGSGSTWFGNVLAGRDVVINHSSTLVGRVLGGASGAGAVSLTGAASPSVTTVTVPED